MTWLTASLAVWSGFVLLFVAAEVTAVVSRGRLPTVDALFRRLAAGPIRRGTLLLAWMWFGWHLFAR